VLEPEGTPKGTYLLSPPTGEIGFNTDSDFWLDAAAFEHIVGRVLKKPAEDWSLEDVRLLQQCHNLYIGELLEGFYDDWAIRERERLRSLMLKSLIRLMDFSRLRQDFETALLCGEHILRYDPLREEVHRQMMQLFLDCGQPAAALRQYNECCRVLSEELGIMPMEETRRLCNRITGGCKVESRNPIALTDKDLLRVALQKMRLALEEFDRAEHKIRRALVLLENVLDDNF
jgi:DNA-binding SARP family transcriptional activator